MAFLKSVSRALRAPLRSQPEGLKAAARRLWAEVGIARATRGSRKAFRSLEGRTDIKLHLGCGSDLRPGWVNVDLFPYGLPEAARSLNSNSRVISHDLRGGLPLYDQSCEYVYSSHFFEHLEQGEGLRLMRDCHRLLKPGGIFRIVLPDFRQDFDAYLRGNAEFFRPLDESKLLAGFEPSTRTFVDYLNYSVYQYGEHRTIYDPEKVLHILSTLGYRSAAISSHQNGIDPDNDLRRRYSFYVEASK